MDTLELCLAAATGMIESLAFHRERLASAAADEFLGATDVADLLVRRGVPFRDAHRMVAGLVRHALERGVVLSELTDEELAGLAPALGDGTAYRGVLADRGWLESKVSEGGTALHRVREQLELARGAQAAVR